MNTIQGSGAGLSAELMRAMDELSRDMRKDHRDSAIHQASEALQQGLEEADDLRDQASSAMTGAIVGGTLTALGGAAQCYSAARMETGLPEAASPAQGGPRAESATGGLPEAPAAGSSPGSAAASPADATQQPNALKERELSLQERQLDRSDAIERRDARNKPYVVATRSGETTATLGANMQKLFETKGEFHAADAREHSARAQAASRRADAEQSSAQDAQKVGEKARDLHQQILSLDHASRMAVLRG